MYTCVTAVVLTSDGPSQLKEERVEEQMRKHKEEQLKTKLQEKRKADIEAGLKPENPNVEQPIIFRKKAGNSKSEDVGVAGKKKAKEVRVRVIYFGGKICTSIHTIRHHRNLRRRRKPKKSHKKNNRNSHSIMTIKKRVFFI